MACSRVNFAFYLYISSTEIRKAAPWLRRLVAGLSPWRPGFDPGSLHVGFVVEKVALGQVFPPSTSVFPCHRCSITWEKRKKLITFNIGLQNRPQGCGRSVASAVGTFTTTVKKTRYSTSFVIKPWRLRQETSYM
jgi:hypothetical protein